ncbi:MAG: hypothetical protein K2O29_10745, partial [Ruminococcus sp.]|nr:hypothetical protein [Ruminococcus sp.]
QNIVEFTPETMDNLRHIFLSINYNELNADSLSIIQTFKNKISNLLTSNTSENEKLDCIQKLQLQWTVYAIEKEIDDN